jgi:hypothetical protein
MRKNETPFLNLTRETSGRLSWIGSSSNSRTVFLFLRRPPRHHHPAFTDLFRVHGVRFRTHILPIVVYLRPVGPFDPFRNRYTRPRGAWVYDAQDLSFPMTPCLHPRRERRRLATRMRELDADFRSLCMRKVDYPLEWRDLRIRPKPRVPG